MVLYQQPSSFLNYGSVVLKCIQFIKSSEGFHEADTAIIYAQDKRAETQRDKELSNYDRAAKPWPGIFLCD